MKKLLLCGKVRMPAGVILLAFCLVFASQRTFVREYTYRASEMDSKVSARTAASAEIRNLLLREVGQFVTSTQTMVDGEYSEKSEAITAGIVEMTILQENWNGKEFYIKAKMVVDEGDVKKRIEAIMKDRQRTDEFRELRKRLLDAEAELALMRARAGTAQAASVAQKEYERKILLLQDGNALAFAVAAYENARYREALEHIRKIKGDPSVYYLLGKIYAGMGDGKRSDVNFKKAADMGHPAAQFRIRKQGYRR